jgi:hypothetical protein
MRRAAKKRCQAPVLDHFSYSNAGISGEYNTDSCNYCGDAFKRRGVGTDALKAHLAGTAVACKKVPEDVRVLFKARTGAVVKARRLSQTRSQLGCSVNPSLQSGFERTGSEQPVRLQTIWDFGRYRTGSSFAQITKLLRFKEK